MHYHYNRTAFLFPRILLRNGSTQNGTICNGRLTCTDEIIVVLLQRENQKQRNYAYSKQQQQLHSRGTRCQVS